MFLLGSSDDKREKWVLVMTLDGTYLIREVK
jgi:hypothetical protein